MSFPATSPSARGASEFDAARRLVERLAAPALLAIPGNHDIPLFNLAARVLDPYGAYARVFGRDLEPSYESGDLLVLGVNTTRAYRHKHGEVSAEQIERVAARLKRTAREQAAHRRDPPADARAAGHGREQPPARPWRGTRAWASAGADLVMGGHIHLPFVRADDAGRPLWVAQAGTAVSRRVRPGGEATR